MSSIPNNVILLWLSTNASIPSGWTRETTLDSTFLKGTAAATNPNDTGGSATHSHTSSAHTHTASNHNHTATLAQVGDSDEGNTNDPKTLVGTHNHPSSSSSATAGGNLQSTAASWAAISSDPAFYSPIFIKSSGGASVNNIAGLWANSANAPSGWTFCDGGGGTPDLRNKYLKGAVAGVDAGTTGGTLNHSHAVDHTHTADSHTHTGTSSAAVPVPTPNRSNIGSSNNSLVDHTHSISLAVATDTLTSYTGSAGNADTVEPSFKKLAAIKNTSGVASKPTGLIGLWLGTLATIPAGWALCDGTKGTPDMRGYHLKLANTLGEIGNTGGSNTHTHSSHNHVHSSSSTHTHTGSTGNDVATGQHATGGDQACVQHTHTVNSTGGTAGSYSTDAMDSGSTNNEPAYRTVAFIQFQFDLGGAILYNLI